LRRGYHDSSPVAQNFISDNREAAVKAVMLPVSGTIV
jgi:dihydroxyacetone kinase-like predicted kinase